MRSYKLCLCSNKELVADDGDQEVEESSKGVDRWIKDDVDDPIDLMDHTALQHILGWWLLLATTY